jgi:signal peptidase I
MASSLDHARTGGQPAAPSEEWMEVVHPAGESDLPAIHGEDRTAPAHQGRRSSWREWVQTVAGAVLLFAFLRGLVVQVYGIQSGSMQPTLLAGDYVIVNNTLFGADLPFISRTLPALRAPRAGDVVVYRPAGYDPVRDHIKRIIGGPGDTVQMLRGVVYRNGTRLREPYAKPADTEDMPLPARGPYNFQWQLGAMPRSADQENYAPTRDNWGPLVVPGGHYLLLGDDRGHSIDTRHTGFVPRSEIRGKVLSVHWSSGVRGVRWSRIGNRP